jgi:8-oxo-dGTP diphosphatase
MESAAVIFVNQRGELLLRLRDDKPTIPMPGHWDLIGGFVEDGETHADAVIREVKEELGLTLPEHAYWRAFEGMVRIHVYVARLEVAENALALTEGQRVAWFSPQEALLLPLAPYMIGLVGDIQNAPVPNS